MIEEGLFKADSNKRTIYGKNKEDIQNKIDKFLQDYKGFNPKVSKILTDEYGRFYVNTTYTKEEGGQSGIKKGFTKTLDIMKKGAEVGKKVISNIPSQETITANSKSALTAKINKIKAESPDAKFGEIKNINGQLSVNIVRKKAQAQTQKPSTDRLSNIQKTLSKLSNDKLSRIETIIKEDRKEYIIGGKKSESKGTKETRNGILIDVAGHFMDALELKSRCHDKSVILKKMEIVKERLPKMKPGKYKVWGMYPDRSRKYWGFMAKWNPNVPEVAFVTYLTDEMGKEPQTSNYDYKLQL